MRLESYATFSIFARGLLLVKLINHKSACNFASLTKNVFDYIVYILLHSPKHFKTVRVCQVLSIVTHSCNQIQSKLHVNLINK